MQLLWVDDSIPPKEEKNNYQMESSPTVDSVSNLYNLDEIPQKEEIENLDFSSLNDKNNIKDNEKRNLFDNLKEKKIHNIIFFKKRLSIILCIIYSILFLINIPKIPIKIGEEHMIEKLIKNATNTKINILINQFTFTHECENNCGASGYLLDFSINKIYLLKWFIGFSYFFVKCICFIYSNNGNDNNYLLNKNRINLIQKISMLFFPLCLFYYDFKNNISYSNIKTEKINNKEISFYILSTKNFSMIDYIEGLIPTLFYFLISIDYDNLELNINIKGKRRNKIKKII